MDDRFLSTGTSGLLRSGLLAALLFAALVVFAAPTEARPASIQQLGSEPSATPTTEAVTSVTQACKKAKKQLKKAKKSGNKAKIKKAKKKVRKAKKRKKKACKTPSNRPPRFPDDPFDLTLREFSSPSGLLLASRDYWGVSPAVDPDGDRLTYTWEGTGDNPFFENVSFVCAGDIPGGGYDGCDATAPAGYPQTRAKVVNRYNGGFSCFNGYVLSVTASDGRGGKDVTAVKAVGGC